MAGGVATDGGCTLVSRARSSCPWRFLLQGILGLASTIVEFRRCEMQEFKRDCEHKANPSKAIHRGATRLSLRKYRYVEIGEKVECNLFGFSASRTDEHQVMRLLKFTSLRGLFIVRSRSLWIMNSSNYLQVNELFAWL